jgi:tripartite-type tricarboxylate transporter receptor subunit TctC
MKLKTLATCLLFAGMVVSAMAEDATAFPEKPIQLVVPYPPGGVNDAVARIVGQQMSDDMGQSVVIVNRPGGGTVIGTETVARARPDGYTLLMINPSSAINVSTYKKLPYDIRKDFKTISLIASYPTLIVASTFIPAKTLSSFIALARKEPGKLNYASGGYGGLTHLAGELFKKMAGVDIVHVPYKGSASTIPPLLSGDAAIAFGDFTTYLPLVKAGKLRALAVAGKERFPDAPDIPTTSEAGLPGYQADVWLGLAVPAGTPDAVVDKLNIEVRKALTNKTVIQRLSRQGVEPVSDSPDEFAALLRDTVSQWAEAVKFAGIKPQ